MKWVSFKLEINLTQFKLNCPKKDVCFYVCVCIYIYIYIFFFYIYIFIIYTLNV